MSDRLALVRLGHHGPQVSQLCLGGNRLGAELDERTSFALLDAFVECGGTFIDTALVYADWVPGVPKACSERLLGRWLAHHRPLDMVIATKGGHPRLAPGAGPRLDVASLREDVERSVDHLGIAPLPLWYLHRDDPARPVGEIVDAAQALVDDGLVLRYAACNWSAKRLGAATEHARANGRDGFVAHQAAFSLAVPDPDRFSRDLVALSPPLLDVHRHAGLPLVAYSPQARGYFAQRAGAVSELAGPYDTPANAGVREQLTRLGARTGLSATQLALRATITAALPVVPVVGPRTLEQLRECVRAVCAPVAGDDLAALTSLARDRLAA